jgi:hypothetical protein
MLHNPFFSGKIDELKTIMKLRDKQDNVYAESKPLHRYPLRDVKLIS